MKAKNDDKQKHDNRNDDDNGPGDGNDNGPGDGNDNGPGDGSGDGSGGERSGENGERSGDGSGDGSGGASGFGFDSEFGASNGAFGIDGAAGGEPGNRSDRGSESGGLGANGSRKRGRPRGSRNGSDRSGHSRAAAARESGKRIPKMDPVSILDGPEPEPVSIFEEAGKLSKTEAVNVLSIIFDGLFSAFDKIGNTNIWALSPKESGKLAAATWKVFESFPKSKSKTIERFLKSKGPWVELLAVVATIALPRILMVKNEYEQQQNSAGASNPGFGARNFDGSFGGSSVNAENGASVGRTNYSHIFG